MSVSHTLSLMSVNYAVPKFIDISLIDDILPPDCVFTNGNNHDRIHHGIIATIIRLVIALTPRGNVCISTTCLIMHRFQMQ